MANVNTITLLPITTENDDFMTDEMRANGGMLNDEVAVNSLLAAIEVAKSRGIDVPKFRVANVTKFPGFPTSIDVKLNSAVTDEFDKLFFDVVHGHIDVVNSRDVVDRIVRVVHNENHDSYTYDVDTTIAMINATNS